MPNTDEPTAPLVTLALLAYNQETLIREAIEGALSQTYSPLEIFVSDDCSTDKTYQIIQEITRTYTGPHRITLNRNEKNLGIGSHINRLMDLVSGEFIVAAAGDDISMPTRVQKLTDRWLETGKARVSVHSAVRLIGIDGEDFGTFRLNHRQCTAPIDMVNNHVVLGASHAWSREIFTIFGKFLDCVTYEDRAICFRSSLLDGLSYIDEPLVKYRIGGSSNTINEESCNDHLFESARRVASILYCDAQQSLTDCAKAGLLESDPIVVSLQRKKIRLFVEMQMASGKHPIPLLLRNPRSLSLKMLRLAVIYSFPNAYWNLWYLRRRKQANRPVTALFETVGWREF